MEIHTKNRFSLGGYFKLVGLLVAGWIGVSWFCADYYYNRLAGNYYQQESGLARKQAENVNSSIDESLKLLKAIPLVVSFDADTHRALRRFGANAVPSPLSLAVRKQRWTQDKELEELNELLGNASTHLNADVVWVVNSAGDCIASSNVHKSESFVGTNYADREYFRMARTGFPGHQYAVGRTTNIPGLFYSTPVFEAGRFLGAVVVKRNITGFAHLIEHDQAFIVDANGVVVLAADKSLELRALPDTTVASWSAEKRRLQYKRDAIETLPITSWGDKRFPLAMRIGDNKNPFLLKSKALPEDAISIYVPRPLGELVRLHTERYWFFLLLAVSGGMLITAVSAVILYLLQSRKVAADLRVAATAFESQEGMVITDADSLILRVNQAFTHITGYTAEELVGRKASLFKSGDQDDGFYAEMWENIARTGTWQGEIQNRRKNGEAYPCWLTITAVKNDAGNVTHYVGTQIDITKRKHADEELHQAKRNAEAANLAKSEFLANMSHEIRTPMNAILGMAELLAESDLTQEQRRYVGVFQNAGNTLLDLINDILDLSKVEAGQMELDKNDFSLEQSLNDQIDLHAIRANDKGLELVLEIKPGVPEFVYGDAKRVRQCLTNLVGNAIKFSSEGGIVVSVSPVDGRPGMLLFSVSDDGIGIPAEKCESIFSAFSQADSSITRRFGGTGLGLTITRRLVNLMGGEIWVDSQEGKGSTFYFTAHLPPATHPVHESMLPTDLRGHRVLVVDDFPINRIIVRQYLQPLGAEVSEAESAKQALVELEEAVEKNAPFDLALVDCQMPDMDGLELSIGIRANPVLASLRIMILSSDDTVQKRQKTKGLALPLLLKPIKRYELIQAIGRELQQHARIPQAEPSPSIAPALSGGLNILLAEDNQDNILLIGAYLKQTRHHLDVAEDGLVAVEMFRKNHYDLILMDVQMPNMDGYEATAAIRRIEAAEGRIPTPVIALTAHALKEDEQRSLDVGCNGHLTKPIKKKVLLEVLQSIGAEAG